MCLLLLRCTVKISATKNISLSLLSFHGISKNLAKICQEHTVKPVGSRPYIKEAQKGFLFHSCSVGETMEDYKEGCLMVWANYMSPCNSIAGLYFEGTAGSEINFFR